MGKSKKVVVKRYWSLKENRAAVVVFEVMDEAVSRFCALKVIN